MMSFLGNVFVCLILSLWLFTLQFTKAAHVNSVVTVARNGTFIIIWYMVQSGIGSMINSYKGSTGE